MLRLRGITACGVMILASFFSTVFPRTSLSATLLYKSYAIRQDQGHDILCDTYLVQQNDYLLKLFRESGEISQTDFPEFLHIFSRINPTIADINLIQAGQRIYIPLKKLSPESLPGQQTGAVSIPFSTISTLPELLKSNAYEYVIQKGDTVSLILSRSFGNVTSKAYQDARQIFLLINPDISDLDMIKIGQSVWVPQTTVLNQPWYPSLFDKTGNLVSGENFTAGNPIPSPPPLPSVPRSSLEKAAALLEGKALNKGAYYFPRPEADDLKLDLSRFPVLELPDRSRALLVPPASTSGSSLSESDVAAMKSFWHSLSILPVDSNAPPEEILEAFFNSDNNKGADNRVSFSDNGVTVSIRARWWLKQPRDNNIGSPSPAAKVGLISSLDTDGGNTTIILNYLSRHGIVLKPIKDEEKQTPEQAKSSFLLPPVIPWTPPKTLVAALMTELGLPYSPDVPISFPYGGIQIPAISNLISLSDGRSLLVDFGSLYGEAIEAITETGLNVVCISPEQTLSETIRMLLTATGHSYEENPTFAAIKAPGDLGTYISIPGFLVSRPGIAKTLLSRVLLDPALIRFLNEREIKIVRIDEENAAH
jgi:hypothetical protein